MFHEKHPMTNRVYVRTVWGPGGQAMAEFLPAHRLDAARVFVAEETLKAEVALRQANREDDYEEQLALAGFSLLYRGLKTGRRSAETSLRMKRRRKEESG